MAFFTRVLYQLSLFDSTVAFLAPRASAVGYLLRPLPSLALLGRCRRRACRPRASVAGYLCARSPRLPPLGRCRRRACRPRASVAGYPEEAAEAAAETFSLPSFSLLPGLTASLPGEQRATPLHSPLSSGTPKVYELLFARMSPYFGPIAFGWQAQCSKIFVSDYLCRECQPLRAENSPAQMGNLVALNPLNPALPG